MLQLLSTLNNFFSSKTTSAIDEIEKLNFHHIKGELVLGTNISNLTNLVCSHSSDIKKLKLMLHSTSDFFFCMVKIWFLKIVNH